VGLYYYLGAQLPYLTYGQAVPMSSRAFRDMVLKEMSPGEAQLLEFCTLEPISKQQISKAGISSAFIRDWHNWEGVLRLTLAKNRGIKLKREDPSLESAPEIPTDAVAAAKQALSVDSPIEAELILDTARWNAIENLHGIGYFTENMIYAYLLKLQLMERRQAFNTEEGFAEYKTLYASILENAGEFE